jgi:hypothetical protein
VSKWLERCRKSHWTCSNSVEQFTPTRLLSIGEDAIRVVLNTEMGAELQYATLSHCWGSLEFVTLTKQNLAVFRSKIPPEMLPRTFKDAIKIAQYLGFRFLWIDSMCIVQDDIDDWKRESAMMCNVYGGSSLNIAASGAEDGSVGCFFSRPQTWRCQVEIGTREGARLHDVVPQSHKLICLSRMPLMRRAWVLQERLLASRTLHFTTTEVFWECHHKSACESFPDGHPSGSSSAKKLLSESMWSSVVHTYSACNLTKAEDKLVAISGLARRIQIQNKDQYVAGMWRKHLVRQLFWFETFPIDLEASARFRSERMKTDTGLYVAPTWSWASMRSGGGVYISFSEHLYKAEKDILDWVEILDVTLHASGPDPFGALSGAILRIGCNNLLQVQLIQSQDKWTGYMVVNDHSIGCRIFEDVSTPYGVERVNKVYALPLFGTTSIDSSINGLLLEATKVERGQYRRVGCFKFDNGRDSKSFERVLSQKSCQLEEGDIFDIRKDKYGRELFIINLI